MISLHCDAHANADAQRRRDVLLRQRPLRRTTRRVGERLRRPRPARDRRAHRPARLPGARRRRGTCCAHTRMPAVRIELGYLTNPGDAARLADPTFRDVVAEAVVVAVQRLYLPPRTTTPDRAPAAAAGARARLAPARRTGRSTVLHRPEHRLWVHRTEQPLEGHLDVLPPRQRVLQLQSQPREAVVRAHRLEADREQVVGRHDAARRSRRTGRRRRPRSP